ncbi:MAG: hypothetical protein LBP88_01870 [Treponema sp.]|jgi:hypothetical protein|nr:hypothetical protein [Treponema sp.]
MKNIVRLVFVFSISFVVLLVISLAVHWLHIRLEPAAHFEGEVLWISVLPVTIYGVMLLSLRYTVRVSIPVPLAIISLVILGLGWTGGLALGINRLTIPAYFQGTMPSLGEPGLMLSRSDKTVVLLQDPHNPQSPQVIAVPDKALVYAAAPQEAYLQRSPGAPLVSFRTGVPAFLQGIIHDFASIAAQLQTRLNEGFLPFMIYVGGLMVLLSSLRFICTLGAWPLAHLGIRILVFRGVLALEALLNTPRIQQDILSLVGAWVPRPLLSPLILYILGVLLIIYTGVLYLVKQRNLYAA